MKFFENLTLFCKIAKFGPSNSQQNQKSYRSIQQQTTPVWDLACFSDGHIKVSGAKQQQLTSSQQRQEVKP